MVSINVVAVIITRDPELGRIRFVLDRASKQISRIVVVDNGSKIKDVLRDLCDGVGNCNAVGKVVGLINSLFWIGLMPCLWVRLMAIAALVRLGMEYSLAH